MVQKTAINLLTRFNNSLHSAWKDLFYHLSSLSSVSLSVISVSMYFSSVFISNSFLNLIFLKSAGQLFHPSCLLVSLSHAFSLLASSYAFFGMNMTEVTLCPGSEHCINSHMILVCNINDVNTDYFVTVVY